MKNPGLAVLWDRLTKMMQEHEHRFIVTIDEIGYYRVVTPPRPAGPNLPRLASKPFGATAVQKKHVGLYLMQLHRNPGIMRGMPEVLITRWKGKCCLHFKDEDDPALEYVPALLRAAISSSIAKGELQEG